LKSIGIAVDKAENFLKSSERVAAEAIKKRNETLEKLSDFLKLKDANTEKDAE